MTAAHTSGPWAVLLNPMSSDSITAADCRICDMPGWDAEYVDEEIANARLIAAAPDLLEELDNCLDLLNTCFPDAAVDSCIGAAIIKARAAIAKATRGSA